MKVGIIGAGAAGLAAAYELGRTGHTAIVYERARRIIYAITYECEKN